MSYVNWLVYNNIKLRELIKNMKIQNLKHINGLNNLTRQSIQVYCFQTLEMGVVCGHFDGGHFAIYFILQF